MKIEIETRFLEIDKKDLIEKLIKFGAVDEGEVKLDEIIFYDKDLKWLDEHRLVRLRKIKDKIKLTYKHNKGQKVDSVDEVEFEVSDFDEAKILLESIGLIAYRVVEKRRHTFILDGVTIDIDEWPRIPAYAEFEGNSVDELKKIVEKLSLKWEDRFDADPRYVYKHYGFDFDKLRWVTFGRFE
jgi:adenylate cyclase class 2